MSAEEIWQAQSPIHGWASEQRARPTAGVDDAPRWADFTDPLEAIARARGFPRQAQVNPAQRADGRPVTPDERRALDLELPLDADRRQLRCAIPIWSTAITRSQRWRPQHEAKLQQVVEAYQLLRKAAAFSCFAQAANWSAQAVQPG
jgi:hypothetical protein